MTAWPLEALIAVAAYLVGAIPFGWLVARWRGVDIFRVGSGNIGATNVGRMVGKWYGVLVFVLDFAKGALPVLVAQGVQGPFESELLPDTLPVVAGVSAFLGHLFPVYLRFRGGKGVATGAGVLAVLVPLLALMVVLTWAVVLAATRLMSLASLTGAAMLVGLRLGLTESPWDRDHLVVSVFCLVASVLVVLRHHENIRRLVRGREDRL